METNFSAPSHEYRTFKLPKKSGGYRTVCAPSSALLSAQRKALSAFEKAFRTIEKQLGLGRIAHGFIKGRNPVTGAKRHIGYSTTIMMDISNFFDNVTSTMVQNVFDRFEDMPKLSDAYFVNNRLAQGFATSPILATIAILPALQIIRTELQKYGAILTVYADDLQISLKHNGDDYSTIENIKILVAKEFGKIGLEINHKKTRTRYAKYGYRKILGINVGENKVCATRRTMRRIRAAKHQENWQSLGGLRNWASCPVPK